MSKKGKLIVIEGLDGSGKGTQTSLLLNRLINHGVPAESVSFPDYKSKSSALVKMYLDGEIGRLDDVNPYAASGFYAADRYISFKGGWGEKYREGGTILCDRYTTSNIVYQTAKLPETEWDGYISWIWDYEFTRLGLPEPDLVLYLDMHPDTSRTLIMKRYGGEGAKMDIHERDIAFLGECRTSALYAADKLGWRVLRCCNGKEPLSIDAISATIWDIVRTII